MSLSVWLDTTTSPDTPLLETLFDFVTGHLKTAWIGRRISATDVGHDTEAIPDRPDGRAVGASGASDPAAQVGHHEGGPTGGGPARDPQRDLLPPAGRVVVGVAPARLPALQDGVPLLRPVAQERPVGAGPRPPPGGRPGRGRTPAPARHRADRQPDREDHPHPGRPRVRRGEKR